MSRSRAASSRSSGPRRRSDLDTHAEVALETLLGTKFVRLTGSFAAPYLKDEPKPRRIIPIERTKTPFRSEHPRRGGAGDAVGHQVRAPHRQLRGAVSEG